MANIVVIVPTYNERESIGMLIDALEHEFESIPQHAMWILIVDGHSPDGTATIVEQKAKRFPNVHLLTEKEKGGLGVAYVNGMQYAIRQMSADAFIEFDGDFQHDPKDIRRLVAAFDEGYDYIIGSRYVLGGSIPKEWAWYRKMLSRFGSLFTRWVLRVPTHDNTSGFKLTRVRGFGDMTPLDSEQLLSRRYAYKIQFLYAMIRHGAKVKEVPIVFLERKGGGSKSTLQDIFDSLRIVLTLRVRTLFSRI